MGEVDLGEIIHRGDGDVGGDIGGVEGAIVDNKVDSTHVALRLYGFISVPTSNTSMYTHVTEADILEYTYIQYVHTYMVRTCVVKYVWEGEYT